MKFLDKKIDFVEVEDHCNPSTNKAVAYRGCDNCKIGEISKLNGCNPGSSEQLLRKFSLFDKYKEVLITSRKGCMLQTCTCIGLHHNELFEEKELQEKMKVILE
jgi:hypothetical protein